MHATKGLRALCLLLLLPAAAFAQTAAPSPNAAQPPPAARPSLAGSWIPSGERDSMPKAGPDGWTKVNVEQRDEAVKFSVVHAAGNRTQNYELTYYADGRGETNRGMVYFFITANSKLAAEEVKSKSSWDGRALVVVHRVSMPDQVVQGGVVSVKLDVTMRWEVSPDGRLLTRTIRQSNYEALLRQIVPEGIKETPLPVNLGKETPAESRDTYVLLEGRGASGGA